MVKPERSLGDALIRLNAAGSKTVKLIGGEKASSKGDEVERVQTSGKNTQHPSILHPFPEALAFGDSLLASSYIHLVEGKRTLEGGLNAVAAEKFRWRAEYHGKNRRLNHLTYIGGRMMTSMRRRCVM